MITNGRRVWLVGMVCALVLALLGASGGLFADKREQATRQGERNAQLDEDTSAPPCSPDPICTSGERCEEDKATVDHKDANAARDEPAFKITTHGKLGKYGEQAVAFAFEYERALILQRNGDLLSIDTKPLLSKPTTRVQAKRILRHVRSFKQSSTFGCAHLNNGSVRCWGEQVGDYGSTSCPDEDAVYTYGKRPQRIYLPQKADAFRSGHDLSCASSRKGIYCWGDRFGGRYDDPKHLTATQGYTLRAVTNTWVCAEKTAGESASSTTDCWTIGRYTREQEPSLSFRGAPRLHGAEDQICVVTEENQITCYDRDKPEVPLKVTGLPKDKEVLELRGQSYFGCARLNDNTARCWGSSFETGLEAFEVPEFGKITALAEYDDLISPICALREDTSIWCIDT